MSGFLGAAYPWVKAGHVIFVIFWMAGLFLFPRFLVYHQEALGQPEQEQQWIKREASLRGMILTPSILIVWVLGIALALNLGLADGAPGLGWLHAKIALVVLLSAYHGWMTGYAKALARGTARLESRRLRMINEIPAIAVILIVILVIVRPF